MEKRAIGIFWPSCQENLPGRNGKRMLTNPTATPSHEITAMISKNAAESFSGTWHIYEMETWDEDYFNMEVQAYIKINPSGSGEFQFGLVFGQLDGEISKYGDDERLEFTWEGNDECDPASGSGWLRLRDKNNMEGKIKLHHADSSKLLAKRTK